MLPNNLSPEFTVHQIKSKWYIPDLDPGFSMNSHLVSDSDQGSEFRVHVFDIEIFIFEFYNCVASRDRIGINDKIILCSSTDFDDFLCPGNDIQFFPLWLFNPFHYQMRLIRHFVLCQFYLFLIAFYSDWIDKFTYLTLKSWPFITSHIIFNLLSQVAI